MTPGGGPAGPGARPEAGAPAGQLERWLRGVDGAGVGHTVALDGVAVAYDDEPAFDRFFAGIAPFFTVDRAASTAPSPRLLVRFCETDRLPVLPGSQLRPVATFVDGDPVLDVPYRPGPASWCQYATGAVVVDRGCDVVVAARPAAMQSVVWRVMRNHVLYPRLQASGRLPLHAAAVAHERGAIVVPGRTGSGKTSVTTPLALHGGWSLLGSDLVFVGTPTSPNVRGTPENITFGPGTLLNSPALAPLVPTRFRGIPPSDARLWDLRDKVSLRVRDFGERFGVPLVAGAPVAAFVFPSLRRTAERVSMRPLGGEEVRLRLLANVTSPEYRGHSALLGALRRHPADVVEEITSLASGLAGASPGYELVVNGSTGHQHALCELVTDRLAAGA